MGTHKVTHLILGLGKGGAETMLYQILKYKSDAAPDYKVISLGLSHYYEDKLEELGIPVSECRIKANPITVIKSLTEIRKELKDTDILCCWMYGANLLGYLLRDRHKKIIWCIRHSDLSPQNNSRKTIWFNKICARLSKNVSLVAYNGYRAKKVHNSAGYRPKKTLVLSNGLDTDEYKKVSEHRGCIREELGINDKQKVILSVARDNKIKDLPTFIKTLALVKRKYGNVVGIMCGSGVDSSNEQLVTLCTRVGLKVGKDIRLLGFREDIAELMNASDVYVLHSKGEAFPNSLIQAMACEVPVVTTDVGDVRSILKSSEYICKVGDYKSLAVCILRILKMDNDTRDDITATNRQIVENNYNIRDIVLEYEMAYSL